jgi:hypothetical protein
MEPIMTPAQLAALLSRKLEETSEELDSHRRSHWFESSIAHFLTGLFHQLCRDLVLSILSPGAARLLDLRNKTSAELLVFYDIVLILLFHGG